MGPEREVSEGNIGTSVRLPREEDASGDVDGGEGV